MTPKDVVWPLEPHTRGKHEVLRHYLKAWFAILGLTQGRIVFIDGFAGPGRYAGGEDGSPIIALDVFRKHQTQFKAEVQFGFIEKDVKRATYLKALTDELKPSLPKDRWAIDVLTGSFDETMTGILDILDAQGQRLAPAFVMVDPFGVSDTPMAVIQRILRGEKTEVCVSFMYRDINRFKATKEFEKPLTDLFGTDEWRKGIDLEGEARKDFFYDLYVRQLRKAGAKYVLHLDLYEGNQLVYAIFFATHHWLGTDRMKQAIWKVAPFGDFSFHGTRSKQLTLGLDTVDYRPLRKALQDRFQGEGFVTIERVIEFVGSDRTDFHSSHVKPVLRTMETEKVIEVDPKTREKQRTFPNGTKLRFL